MAKTSAELKAEAAALQEQMKVAGAAAAELRQQARALERKELRERQEWERAEHASQMWREGRPADRRPDRGTAWQRVRAGLRPPS